MECLDTLREILSFLPLKDLLNGCLVNKEFYSICGKFEVYTEFIGYKKSFCEFDCLLMVENGYPLLFRHFYNNENSLEYFRSACENGRLEIAKWLFSRGKINVNSDYVISFCNACRNGYIRWEMLIFMFGMM